MFFLRKVLSKRDVPIKTFIHVPKNAGVSLRSAFRGISFIKVTNPYHVRVRDLTVLSHDKPLYFAVVRNPWSRVASRFFYAKKKCVNWKSDDPRRIYVERSNFQDFVMAQPSFDIPQHPGKPWLGPFANWYDQLEWLTDSKGVVVATCLRFEYLENDLRDFLGMKVKLPLANKTSQRFDYRTLYTDAMIEAVCKRHHRDISYFGFDFEGGAKRNYYRCGELPSNAIDEST